MHDGTAEPLRISPPEAVAYLLELDAHRLLSYRLLWFETEPRSRYPARALAAVTTHDLPTLRGCGVARTSKRSTHQLLAEAPSAVILATLEDALAVAEQPNMPNTTAEWPNWLRALPCPLAAIERHLLVQAVATALPRGDKRTE